MLTRARNVVVVLCLLVSGGALGGVVVGASPAAAASVTLCKGYAGCARLELSNAGYQAKSRTMYWRMYAGHNCTNYVAYRMIRAGMPNTRPWTGSGNATNWGVQMSNITDQQPRVGAVAWWRANVPGADFPPPSPTTTSVPSAVSVTPSPCGSSRSARSTTCAGRQFPAISSFK